MSAGDTAVIGLRRIGCTNLESAAESLAPRFTVLDILLANSVGYY
jgi:hypothetical protein